MSERAPVGGVILIIIAIQVDCYHLVVQTVTAKFIESISFKLMKFKLIFNLKHSIMITMVTDILPMIAH